MSLLNHLSRATRRHSTARILGVGARMFASGRSGQDGRSSGPSGKWFTLGLAAVGALTAYQVVQKPVAACDTGEDPAVACPHFSALTAQLDEVIKPVSAYGTLNPVTNTMMYTHQELKEMVQDGHLVMAFQGSLYDVSKFTGHPGGIGRLQMAAGGDLEVFWRVYMQHNRGHITQDVMVDYKIGDVSPEDMAQITADTSYDDSAYANNPPQYPDLLTNTLYPYNAEARLRTLTDSWITPAGKHFVRNHSAVPDVDIEEYRLTIEGEGLDTTVFTLDELKNNFKKVDVTTVIQCNGNRREDFHYSDGKSPAFGPPHWVAGAISNATWSGPRLRDVLRAAGMDVDSISLGTQDAPPKATQVGLLGMDHDEVGNQYCCSFPFDKAIDPFGDVILAYQMNGEDIPRSHGYPVRAIVPGHAGARNCKYLEKVTITDSPCCEFCNWKQYAVHAPDVALRKIAEFDVHHEELKKDPAVQEMPVQSLITYPGAGDIISTVKNGAKSVYVKGIAWGGGGAGINRVDVSMDNGETFTRADVLETPIKQRRRSHWSWVFFEKNIPISEETRSKILAGEPCEVVLCSKALNSAWNVQPDQPKPNWNSHGCCVNHWYRVPVTLCPYSDCDKKCADGDFGNKPSGGKFSRPFRNQDKPCEARARKEGEDAILKNIQDERNARDCCLPIPPSLVDNPPDMPAFLSAAETTEKAAPEPDKKKYTKRMTLKELAELLGDDEEFD